MRAFEFIKEEVIENIDENGGLEDAADSRGDENIIAALGTLKNQSQDTHTEPRIKMGALVNILRNMPGTEMFSAENLKDAAKSNPKVKALVKDIKDNDEGISYVYISTDSNDESDELNPQAPTSNPEKTVGSMAKRALGKRD
jgi:hypothetical protein